MGRICASMILSRGDFALFDCLHRSCIVVLVLVLLVVVVDDDDDVVVEIVAGGRTQTCPGHIHCPVCVIYMHMQMHR